MYEIDWIVADDTVVRHDVIITCGDVRERHVESAPSFVCEILSPVATRRDLEAKRGLYEENGVTY